jgi:hypothetical protein
VIRVNGDVLETRLATVVMTHVDDPAAGWLQDLLAELARLAARPTRDEMLARLSSDASSVPASCRPAARPTRWRTSPTSTSTVTPISIC